MAKNKNYTAEQLAWLKKHRKTTRTPKLTEKFNARFGTEISKGTLHALCVRNGWYSDLKRGREIGAVPWNKGLKTGLLPKSAFQQGHVSERKKPLFSEIIRGGDIVIKVAETGDRNKDYIAKRRYIWQQHHGEIPKGFMIRHKDGNPRNFAIENLELISKRESVLLNKLGFQKESEEIKPILREFIRLKSKIHELEQQCQTN